MLIYYIEDDIRNANYWMGVCKESYPKANIVWFDTPLTCWQQSGNPDYIILDVGSIGLRGKTVVDYLRVYYQLREKWLYTRIIITSGIWQLPVEIKKELQDDLVYASAPDWVEVLEELDGHCKV